MNEAGLKHKLYHVYTGKELMEWEVFRYPVDENEVEGKTIVEFAGKVTDEDFGKDTFSFYSGDDERYTWMLDPEQRLTKRAGAEEKNYEGILGGPTIMEFETAQEAALYIVYILEALNAASFYYSTKDKQMLNKKEG